MTDQNNIPETPQPQDVAGNPIPTPTAHAGGAKAHPQQTPTSPVNVTVDKVDELVAHLVAARSPASFHPDAPFVIVPNSLKVLDVEQSMPRPARTRKDITFTDVAGFTGYFETFRVGFLPRIFSTIDENGIDVLGVLDYDVPTREVKDETSTNVLGHERYIPSWCDHKIRLNLNHHRDFKALLDLEALGFVSQQDFAYWVEERLYLFSTPTGADMLEIAQELKGTQSATWKSGKRLANGQVSLEYTEQINGQTVRGEPLEIPEYIYCSTPIYEGFAGMNIKVALRWRLDTSTGKVFFAIRVLAKEEERLAQDQVIAKITEITGLPVLAVLDFDGITCPKSN